MEDCSLKLPLEQWKREKLTGELELLEVMGMGLSSLTLVRGVYWGDWILGRWLMWFRRDALIERKILPLSFPLFILLK
jgi:hypothetical protein